MERDQGVYQPYFPSQQLPIAQWDNSGQGQFLQVQQQGLQGNYQYNTAQPYQQQQQRFQQPQYGYQTQPGFAANPYSHTQTRQPGQRPKQNFVPGQGQYFDAQSAGGPSRSGAAPLGWQPTQSTSMPGGGHHQRQPKSSYSRVSGSSSAYGGGGSSDGPSNYYQSSGASSGISTPHHGTAPSMSSMGSAMMSHLPAKPTFEPSGGAVAGRQSPRSSIGAVPNGNSNAAGPSGVGTGGGKLLSKSSLSMGHQLLDRLPPLPPLPEEANRPSSLDDLMSPKTSASCQETNSTERDSDTPAASDDKQPDEAEETRQYLSSLLAVIEAYKAREDAMQMRMEALAFRPAESWRTISAEMAFGSEDNTTLPGGDDTSTAAEGSRTEEAKQQGDSLGPAPVLGVRLLRKVSELQKENEELGELLSQKLGLDEGHTEQSEQPEVPAEELQQARADLEDAHQLLNQLSAALKASEARAERAERALEAAVQSKSVGVLG